MAARTTSSSRPQTIDPAAPRATPAPGVALVMPVANEIATIGRTYAAIDALARNDLVWIPVLDAVSRDGTREWIAAAARRDRRIEPLDIGPGRGLARAYLAGYRRAYLLGAPKVLEVDAGLSHAIADVPAILDALDARPVVASTRLLPPGGFVGVVWQRRWISRLGTLLARRLLGIPLSDCTGGLLGLRREVLGRLDLDGFLSRHHMVQTELKYYCRHLPWGEVPTVYRGSTSTLRLGSLTDAARVFLRLLADRWRLRPPLQRRAPRSSLQLVAGRGAHDASLPGAVSIVAPSIPTRRSA
jgi:dolichol-phosphate mannosyltransferase